ncbi:hypothetical protein QWY14_10390 [Planococcus sp. N028]|uniref:Uncharacterized protein n=1 Tax=Planococcus shixiaomingii TaxID=3058393 RepID=A0ABT8N3R4_9BACL|nr:hypothetical protein [Planococcus sp. N028]MDN7242210.1 hypothetical protein [Planococcus sp. N028]
MNKDYWILMNDKWKQPLSAFTKKKKNLVKEKDLTNKKKTKTTLEK